MIHRPASSRETSAPSCPTARARRSSPPRKLLPGGITYACDVPSSPNTSHSRSEKSPVPRTRSSSGRYRSCTPSQSMPDMSARQKSRRISRPASRYACRHSASGSAVNRALDRSTVTTSSAESPFGFRSAGSTRSLPPSRTTSRVPSPLATNQSASSASSVTSRLAQAEPLERGPRPVAAGLRVAVAEHAGDRGAQPRQPALHRIQRGVVRLGDRHGDHARGDARRYQLSPRSGSESSADGSPSGRPPGSGPNGDGVVAASVTRYGRAP